MLDSKGGRLLVRPLSVTTLVVQYSNSRLVKRFPQTALCSNKFILIYCSFDWLHGCKYTARKYIVRMTECLFQDHHAVLLGQSSTATHNYLLGYICTLDPSLYCHPVRSHLFMFITVSHLPEEDDWRFRRGPRWDLRASSSPIVARGAEAFHPHSDYESVTRHKRNNNSWWYFVSKTFKGKLSL